MVSTINKPTNAVVASRPDLETLKRRSFGAPISAKLELTQCLSSFQLSAEFGREVFL